MKKYRKLPLTFKGINNFIETFPHRTCCEIAGLLGVDPNKLSSRLNKLANKNKIYRYLGNGVRTGKAWRYLTAKKGAKSDLPNNFDLR